MNIGAKETNRLRDWDDDYLEGFSEYLSEDVDSADDDYDTLICQTCNDGQLHPVWHTGFDRFVQVLLPVDKYRCSSCGATRWQFNYFKGFTASTFVLYAVSLALVLFFGTTTLGILLDRQNNDFSGAQAPIVNADPSEVSNNVTTVSGAATESSPSRFDEISGNPLSNTLFEPIDETTDANNENVTAAGVVLLPAAFRITFVPDASTAIESENQRNNPSPDSSPGLSPDQEDLDVARESSQEGAVAPADKVLADEVGDAAGNNVALNQPSVEEIGSENENTEEQVLNTEQTAAPVAPSSSRDSIAAVDDVVDVEVPVIQNVANGGAVIAQEKVASEREELVDGVNLAEKNIEDTAAVEAEIVETSYNDENSWLFGQSPNAYTLQLGSFNSLDSAMGFVSNEDLPEINTHVLETASNEKIWFYVLYGSYDLKADVEAAIDESGFNAPLIRKFSGLQTKRCASWETSNDPAFSANCQP